MKQEDENQVEKLYRETERLEKALRESNQKLLTVSAAFISIYRELGKMSSNMPVFKHFIEITQGSLLDTESQFMPIYMMCKERNEENGKG